VNNALPTVLNASQSSTFTPVHRQSSVYNVSSAGVYFKMALVSDAVTLFKP